LIAADLIGLSVEDAFALGGNIHGARISFSQNTDVYNISLSLLQANWEMNQHLMVRRYFGKQKTSIVTNVATRLKVEAA